MHIKEIHDTIPAEIYSVLQKQGIEELRPSQQKAIKHGLLDGKSLLVCTPTASGKTLIAELAGTKRLLTGKGKMVYIVPLKALASEKYKEFKTKYDKLFTVALSIGDKDASDSYLADYDIILCTAEKLDSLLRHHCSWITQVGTLIVDEIHLLNDASRGPTLEILITILRSLLKNVQLIALSATIGNPKELADWLGATLVQDTWRPVKLHKCVYHDGKVEFE